MKVKQIIAQLEADGWQYVRTRGSHRQFKHPEYGWIETMNTDNIKTPLTRLLDLTAGWANFVQKDKADVIDPAISTDELSPAEEAHQVRRFIEDRVLPMLLREKAIVASARSSSEKVMASVSA